MNEATKEHVGRVVRIETCAEFERFKDILKNWYQVNVLGDKYIIIGIVKDDAVRA